MADDPASLDLDPATMRAMAHAVVDRVITHLATIGEQPARGPLDDAADRCRAMREPVPEHGVELDRLLGPLFDEWVPRSFNAPGPGYLAYIPGGGLFPSALADFMADAVNRYTGIWNAAPLLVQLEANVLDWLRGFMGFPPEARGLLTSGGSMATFGAVVAARERLLGTRLREGVLYTSTQAHHCIEKAARLAGILPDRVRVLPVDARQRLRVDALADAIADDRRRGLVPFFVASSAGTVNTGAVDPLDAVADVAAEERLWHHVDGAYGGFFRLVPELRPLLDGIARADSVALDPHKGLFLPYGTGALLVRDGSALRAPHAFGAGYLPELPDAELYSPSDYGPELSRPFRGLRVWLPLKLFGLGRFRAALAEKRALALLAAERIAAMPGVELAHPPELSLFAFRLAADAHNRSLVERVTARGRAMITGSEVDGRFWARVCVLCFRTRRVHVERCVEDIGAEIALLSGGS
jgi:aromatic-L-amino-acid/L-tryptophan decarboxylase